MKRAFLILSIITISISAMGQKTAIKWYTIEDAEKMVKNSPRPLFIDTYTDWCGWCKKLDAETFSNPVIAEILNSRFYPVKFDAEAKDPVVFQGQTFINDGKSGKFNQLAVALLKGQMSFPNLVFFNEKLQLVTNVPGYMVPKDLEVILAYMADKAYESQKFEDYSKSFKGKL